jgi:ABC-type nitrate/sulfonate/bicarbonate transport system substrate-binding protein
MKKVLSFLMVALLFVGLIGCNTDSEPLTVMAPNGAPALAQIFVQDDSENYTVDVVNGADPLAAAFGSGSHDFIFAPTNLGAKLYTSGIEYKFIAAVTFGNYFLASTQENFTLESLEGKEVIVFGQNSTSDIVLKYVLSENDINVTFSYVDAVTTANAALIADNSKIILSAEPLLSVLANQVTNLNTIDLQTEYQEITGKSSYPQAGVFAKASLTSKQINRFLDDLEDSINKVNNDLDNSIAKALELEYTFPESVLRTAIPNSHISFVTAEDVKDDLEAYFNIILEMNGALIGNQLPDDDFYF